MSGRSGGAVTVPVATRTLLPELASATSDFVIGVIDTGVLALDGKPHPYLADHLADGWQADARGGGLDGHGTFVSGLILAQAPSATIAMRNALDESAGAGDDDRVVAALASLAREPHLKLINLSFFGEHDVSGPPLGIRSALGAVFEANDDVVVIIAAGNEWTSEPTWPAAFSRTFPGRVIAVGAVDETILRSGSSRTPPVASFSNHGAWVDAYAGGVQVLGPRLFDDEILPDGHTGWLWSGTSFAAAKVTGLIARTVMDSAMTGGHPLNCRQALDQVLAGPPLALAYNDYRPYIWTGDEEWKPAPLSRGSAARDAFAVE